METDVGVPADGREHWQFLDPDEPAQMRARIEELEIELKLARDGGKEKEG